MVLLRALTRSAKALGVAPGELCSRVGVTSAQLEIDTSIPTVVLAQAWGLAPEMSGDPFFGLHAGQHAELGSYDVLDYLFLTAPTLGDGCRAVERYYRVITDIWRIGLVVDGGVARFQHWIAPSWVEPLVHAWDYFFSGAFKRFRAATTGDFHPRVVRLMRSAPSDAREHEALFGCPVEFAQPVGEFVFGAELLSLPLVSANFALHRLVRRHADDLLARVPSERDLLDRARRLIPDLLSDSSLSLATLATRLGVGERTLQRALGEQGLTYQRLIDRMREEHAVRELEAGALSMQEIAFSVGFNGPAAFTRAFKRWRGVSPTEFRRARPPKT